MILLLFMGPNSSGPPVGGAETPLKQQQGAGQ
jgi:hypothetical protein